MLRIIFMGAFPCQKIPERFVTTEEPIRFLGGKFHGLQTRWSTIEKAGLGYLLGTSTTRRSHQWRTIYDTHIPSNPTIYDNNHGSKKILQWKLDIQHYDAVIKHVLGKANISADIFSREIISDQTLPLFHILALQ